MTNVLSNVFPKEIHIQTACPNKENIWQEICQTFGLKGSDVKVGDLPKGEWADEISIEFCVRYITIPTQNSEKEILQSKQNIWIDCSLIIAAHRELRYAS